MEGDLVMMLDMIWIGGFNPRLPDGGRRLTGSLFGFFSSFNPRLPDGGRQVGKLRR